MTSQSPTLLSEGSARWLLSWVPRGQNWALLVGYAAAFWLAHEVASPLGGVGYYSLWFPAAGVRLALLWRGGARLTVPAALVELIVDTTSGAVNPLGADWAM